MRKQLYSILLTLITFSSFAIDSVKVATSQPYFSEEPENQVIEYFIYDTETNRYVVKNDMSPGQSFGFSGDPLFFYLSANKSEVSVGEEVEITITIRRPRIHPGQMFTFDHLLDYKVGLILPDGFILTSGQRAEFEGSFRNKSERIQEYKVTGYFEYFSKGLEPKVLLVRGLANTDLVSSIYIKKDELLINEKANTFINNRFSNVVMECGGYSWIYESLNGEACNYFEETEVLGFDSECYTIENISGGDKITVLENSLFFAEPNGVKLSYSTEALSFKIMHKTPYSHAGTFLFYANNKLPVTPISNKEEVGIGESVNIYFDKSNACQNSTITWFYPGGTNYQGEYVDGNNIGITVSFSEDGGKSIYYECENNCDKRKYSQQVFISVLDGNHESISIESDKETVCPCEIANLKVTGGSSCNSSVGWKKNGTIVSTLTGLSINVTYSEIDDYSAYCTGSGLTSNTIAIEASTLSATPTIIGDREFVAGSYTTITAQGCNGTVYWAGGNINNQSGTSVNINQAGNYEVRCDGSCGLSDPNTFSVSQAGLKITKDKDYCIYDNEYITLTLEGCTNGVVQWEYMGQTYTGGQQSFPSPGSVVAKCFTINGNTVSEVTTEICRRYPGSVSITSSSEFATYNTVLTAIGCQGTVEWNWSTGSSIGTTKIGDLPTTYKARCQVGNSYGPWSNYTLVTEPANYVYFIPSKTSVKQDEAFYLNPVGSCNGLLRYTIPEDGQYIFASSAPLKVYGPGEYIVQCFTSDYSSSIPYSQEIQEYILTSNAPSLSSSRGCAKEDDIIRLAAAGCEGQAAWTLPDGSIKQGSSIDARGPGTYKASCLSRSGQSGPESQVVIPNCPANYPSIISSATSVASGEPAQLYAECASGNIWKSPNGTTYWARQGDPFAAIDPGTYEVFCQPNGPWVSFEIADAPANALIITASKYLVQFDESSVLTATGCEFGEVHWKTGIDPVTGEPIIETGNSITVNGPGTYEAWCVDDLLNDGNPKYISLIAKGGINPILADGLVTRACPNEPVTLTASCPGSYQVDWMFVREGQEANWLQNRNQIDNHGQQYWQTYSFTSGQNTVTTTGPGYYWARCRSWDYSWLGPYYKTPVVVNEAFPDYFQATSNSPNAEGLCSGDEANLIVRAPYLAGVTYSWSSTSINQTFDKTSESFYVTNPTDDYTGIYTVTGTRNYSGGSCSATSTTNVVIRESPEVTSISGNSPVSLETFLVLEAEIEDENNEFFWSGPAGFASDEAETGLLVTSLNQSGTYTFTVTDPHNGCSFEETVDIEVLDFEEPTSIQLGDQLPNPYLIGSINEAYDCIKDYYPEVTASMPAEIEANYIYTRLLPNTEEEYIELIYDESMALYNYPMDYEILTPGDNYFDSSVTNNNYTWLYTAVDINRNINSSILREDLEEIFLPFGNGIDPEPTYSNSEKLFYMRLEKASEILVDPTSGSNLRGIKTCPSPETLEDEVPSTTPPPSTHCHPNGRITVEDQDLSYDFSGGGYTTGVSGFVPVVGAKVVVRENMFRTKKDTTNQNGEFEITTLDLKINKSYNFGIIWDCEDFDIRLGSHVQAKYIEKDIIGCEWEVEFTRQTTPYQYLNAHVHRGAWNFYYNNVFGVLGPPTRSEMGFPGKLNLAVRLKKATLGNFHPHFFEFNRIAYDSPEIRLPLHAPSRTGMSIFSTTIHELTHARHWKMGMNYANYCDDSRPKFGGRIAESWADAMEWHVVPMIYGQNQDVNELINQSNHTSLQFYQEKGNCLNKLEHFYTPIFIDLMDDYNQSSFNQFLLLDEEVDGFSINDLENIIYSTSNNWFDIRTKVFDLNKPKSQEASDLFFIYIPQD